MIVPITKVCIQMHSNAYVIMLLKQKAVAVKSPLTAGNVYDAKVKVRYQTRHVLQQEQAVNVDGVALKVCRVKQRSARGDSSVRHTGRTPCTDIPCHPQHAIQGTPMLLLKVLAFMQSLQTRRA